MYSIQKTNAFTAPMKRVKRNESATLTACTMCEKQQMRATINQVEQVMSGAPDAKLIAQMN